MSQYPVGVFNDTNDDIEIWNSESEFNRKTIQPATMMVIQGSALHWNIPDCDDPKNLGGHMEIRAADDHARFSFWDTSRSGRAIFTCPGTDYAQRMPAPGASTQGEGANVIVHVSDRGIYVLVAVTAES